jgi:hypothetical protein
MIQAKLEQFNPDNKFTNPIKHHIPEVWELLRFFHFSIYCVLIIWYTLECCANIISFHPHKTPWVRCYYPYFIAGKNLDLGSSNNLSTDA